jgi:hypothetical protein
MRAVTISRHPARARCRTSFTLIELSAAMAALGVILLLVTAIVLGAFRADQLIAGTSNRLDQQHTLADNFRGDVGGASAAPDGWDRWKAGPACLVLRRPDGNHVVYQFDAGTLRRHEQGRSGTLVRPQPVGIDGTTVEFTRGGPGNRLLTLRLTEPQGRGAPRQIDISAALGGDIR